MEGGFQPPKWLRWFEKKLDTGEQTWKGYAVSLIVFNAGLFVAGFVILALQPWMPMNQDHRGPGPWIFLKKHYSRTSITDSDQIYIQRLLFHTFQFAHYTIS